jgi:hypothetical protein
VRRTADPREHVTDPRKPTTARGAHDHAEHLQGFARLVQDIDSMRNANAVLWATHTDEELRAIEASIVASIPPTKIASHLRWIVPALPPADRLAMMQRMRAIAPAAFFDAALAAIEPHLADREWMKLAKGLAG